MKSYPEIIAEQMKNVVTFNEERVLSESFKLDKPEIRIEGEYNTEGSQNEWKGDDLLAALKEFDLLSHNLQKRGVPHNLFITINDNSDPVIAAGNVGQGGYIDTSKAYVDKSKEFKKLYNEAKDFANVERMIADLAKAIEKIKTDDPDDFFEKVEKTAKSIAKKHLKAFKGDIGEMIDAGEEISLWDANDLRTVLDQYPRVVKAAEMAGVDIEELDLSYLF